MKKKHTLNPEIAFLYQFHAQKALFKVPKICNINFWIENDPPFWNFSENSSDLAQPSFCKHSVSYLFGTPCIVRNSCNEWMCYSLYTLSKLCLDSVRKSQWWTNDARDEREEAFYSSPLGLSLVIIIIIVIIFLLLALSLVREAFKNVLADFVR